MPKGIYKRKAREAQMTFELYCAQLAPILTEFRATMNALGVKVFITTLPDGQFDISAGRERI